MEESNEILNLIRAFELRESELKLDIVQLRILNQTLRVAEEKSAILNSIVESSDDAIISKNLDGIITSWNTAACRIFGYSAEEIIGQPVLKLIPPDRHDEEPRILEQLRNGIRVDHFETQRRRKDGTTVEVSLTISPILNGEGKIIGLSKIARDLTFNRSAETNSKMLSAIIASSDDAIISKNLNSIITSWNDSAERIFGYKADEIIGQSILTLIPENRLDEEPKILDQLKRGIRVDHFETERLRKDGTLVQVSLTISPIKDRMGKVIGLSKIARDITDQKLAERKKDEFLGFVSHELKTPLTSLRSYIQVAAHKVKIHQDAFIETVLSRAELQTKKMENMITDFLSVSKIENGHLNVNLSRFNVVEMIGNCLDDARISSVKHSLHYEGPERAYTNGDSEKLSLVLTNLLSNAQKYTPQGGPIHVSCILRDDKISILVQDQGLGISIENQNRLCEKFFRVSNPQTKFIGGFGIGLYLVSTILALHGTVLKVDSEPGKGSTFSFELNSID